MSQGLRTTLGVFGLILYFLTGWLYLASGLVVPVPWYFLFVAGWLAGWWVVARVFRDRRAMTPLVAVAAIVLWLVVVQFGGTRLGWTA